MGIQSSLYSGVSGLNANGSALTVLGNNIANSNTIGFKTSRTVFADLLSAEIAGSGGASQVGRGTGMSTVDTVFSQGTFESTESNTDLAIEGPGFFMVSSPEEATVNYTRAGAFRFDEGGTLVNPEGFAVQGYALNEDGETMGDIADIAISTRSFSPAEPTAKITLATNLNANDPYLGLSGDGVSPFTIVDPAAASNYASSVRIFDSLGSEHLVTTYFNKLDPTDNPSGVMQWESHTVVAESELESPAQILADDVALAAATTATATATTDLATAETDLTANAYVDLLATRDSAYSDMEAVLPSTTAPYVVLLAAVTTAQNALDDYTGSMLTTETAYTDLLGNLDTARGSVYAQAVADAPAYDTVAAAYNTANLDVATANADPLVVDAYNVAVADRDAAITDLEFATANLASKDAAASDWVEVGRSVLSFDTGGRLVNVKDINSTIATGASVVADRAYDAAGDLYISSNAATGYSLPTDVEEVASAPNISTINNKLTWLNESESTQVFDLTFNATQYSSESDVISQTQDGYGTGTLVSLTIDNDGNILGNYSNGEPRKLAKIALAKFANPLGLSKVGNNMYGSTEFSGTPIVGTVGSGVGQIFTNSLEMSNVDLAAEFVKMITTQRGFQANSKIITTTDELLGELINLKR